MSIGTILLIILVLLLVGAFRLGLQQRMGIWPSDILGVIVVVILVLLLLGRI